MAVNRCKLCACKLGNDDDYCKCCGEIVNEDGGGKMLLKFGDEDDESFDEDY